MSIIGISNNPLKKKIYGDNNIRLVNNINPYLIEFPNEIIYPLSKPISCFPIMDYGVKAVDGGNLILSTYEKDLFLNNHPNQEYFIRKFIGSEEYINGKDRFCLWIDDEKLTEALEIQEIASRIENVKQMRLNSRDEGAQKLAQRAHQFREHPELSECIIIPRVSSERREYIPIGYLDAGTVVADSAFAIYDAPLWLFGILTSKMHMAWVKTVGGRLKTDYRYSAQLCYNTFPFPAINEAQKAELEKLAQEVLDVRDQHFDMTLGEQYNPETMPEALKEVHHRLDLAVERCYRPEPFSSDEERLECLFKLYAKMTKK